MSETDVIVNFMYAKDNNKKPGNSTTRHEEQTKKIEK